MHSTLHGLIWPVIGEGSFKSTKTMYHLIHPAIERSKIFCFASIAQRLKVSPSFVYNTVDVSD